jgi:hypothetical protein
MSDLIFYQFSQDHVEAGDAKDFLFPTSKKLKGMMNSVAFYKQHWQRL